MDFKLNSIRFGQKKTPTKFSDISHHRARPFPIATLFPHPHLCHRSIHLKIFLAIRWNPRFSHDFPVAIFRFLMYAPPALADYVSISDFNHSQHYEKISYNSSASCAHFYRKLLPRQKSRKTPKKLLIFKRFKPTHSTFFFAQTTQFRLILIQTTDPVSETLSMIVLAYGRPTFRETEPPTRTHAQHLFLQHHSSPASRPAKTTV